MVRLVPSPHSASPVDEAEDQSCASHRQPPRSRPSPRLLDRVLDDFDEQLVNDDLGDAAALAR